MEALKNIKLFWKILLEKLFNINISKASNFDNNDNCRNDSARDVARNWQKEMLRQALFVKALSPQLSRRKKCDTGTVCKESNIKKSNCAQILRPPCSERDCVDLAVKLSRVYYCHCKFMKCKDNECDCNLSKEGKTEKKCECVSVRVKTATVACNTCESSVNITKLKNENIAQRAEMKKLRNENILLKRELQKAYDEVKWREAAYSQKLSPLSENPCALLNTFEENELTDDTNKLVRDAESEMIITLQNCKNEVSPLSYQ